MIKLNQQDAAIVEMEVAGKVTKSDYEAVLPELDSAVKQHGAIRMLVHVHNLEGVQPTAVFKDLQWDWENRKNVERAAVVGDQGWLALAGQAADLIYAGDVQTFEPDKMEEARHWLRAA